MHRKKLKNSSKINILLLSNPPPANAKTIDDHINAFTQFSRHNVYTIRNLAHLNATINQPKQLAIFDALIIHYSIYTPTHLTAECKQLIGEFSGIKVMFIQDEFRHIDAIHDAISAMKIDILYTCMPSDEIDKVYPATRFPNLRKINNLTGYVPADLLHTKILPYEKRPIDVGYRSRKLPLWMGKLAIEKWQIVDKFKQAMHDEKITLKTDLAYQENQRIYGKKWVKFVSSCKAVLGVESGASVFDFTGEIGRQAEEAERQNPSISYEELHERYFKDKDGLIIQNQISPRCFEAAALKSLMVLYEGEYSGILKPWKHYVPLKKDFSNFNEVVAVIQDPVRAKTIIENAYLDIACNPQFSYETFIREFDEVILSEYSKNPSANSLAINQLTAYPLLLPVLINYGLVLNFLHVIGYKLTGVYYSIIAYRNRVWHCLPPKVREICRPIVRFFLK